MGNTCCVSQGKQSGALQRKKLLNKLSFPDSEICFTKQKALRLIADCAIIHIAQRMDLSQNILLRDLTKDQIKALEFKLRTNKQGKFPVSGEFFIQQNNSLTNLQVKHLAFVCLPMYKGSITKPEIRTCYYNFFELLMKKNFQSFIISEVQQELGIPAEFLCNTILQSLYNDRQKIKNIFFVFKDQINQNYYLQIAQKFTINQARASVLSQEYR